MSTSPAATSKREQKRQAKLAKELAEKSLTNGSTPPIATSSETVPTDGAETNGASATTTANNEQKPSPFIEPVQKRIRNYLKKKQKIDQLLEKASDPEEYKKLNKDQLEQIARKDQILAPLKELQNLAEQFTQISEEHNRSLSNSAAETSKTHAIALEAPKEEGIKEGKGVLSALLAFLGHASLLRANPTENKDFNDANERLLNIVYLGGDVAIDAATKLSAGSNETVDDTAITYKQIHEAIFPSSKASAAQSPAEESGADGHAGESQQVSSANFVSLSELASKPSSIGAGGISFLNESEIEGTAMPESVAAPAATQQEAAPGQTVAEADGNKAAENLTWASMETARTNWADEDIVESQSSTVPTTENVAPPPEEVPEKGGLQPLSDFKTIEKKSSNRDGGRGRGRGSGRGRGGDNRGRGRGNKPKTQDA